MGNKINISQLLKDCPQGMELDCVMYDNVTLDRVSIDGNYDSDYPIKIKTPNSTMALTKYGQYFYDDFSKCVIYPKGKTTWEGFVPPCKFKDGDILYVKAAFDWICIYKESEDEENVYKYVAVEKKPNADGIFKDTDCLCCRKDISEIRLASKEEKEKLFHVIKNNGYRWDAETKTLEKLVKDKFDINTLVPFESKVLIRNDKEHHWIPAFWGCKCNDDEYVTTYGWSLYCIPYEGNEHLLGTTDDCEDYYKSWE